MKLKLGQVWSNTDVNSLGRMLVKIDEFDQAIEVKYVTPYKAGVNGGFIAIPEVGSKILVCQTDNYTEGWFYLGTIVDLPEPSQDPNKVLKGLDGETIVDKEIYRARQVPQRIVIRSPMGNSLILSDSYNPKYFNVKAELKSSLGKKISMIDGGGPEKKLDCILIRNEHGDRIKLTSEGDTKSAARSLELETRGPQRMVSRESQIDMIVQDGKEINLVNNSTGMNRAPFPPDREQYGNINLESKNRDINVTVRAVNGRVFIDALGIDGLIQIDSNNQIIISGREVNIVSQQNTNVVAKGNLNLVANNNINIRAGNTLTLDGTIVDISPNSPPDVPTDITKDTNHYGN